jgi:hypothetical protein
VIHVNGIVKPWKKLVLRLLILSRHCKNKPQGQGWNRLKPMADIASRWRMYVCSGQPA